MIFALTFVMCGCMIQQQTFVINSDGSSTYELASLISKSGLYSFEKLIGDDKGESVNTDKATVVTIDGQEYYKYAKKMKFKKALDFTEYLTKLKQFEGIHASKTGFRFAFYTGGTIESNGDQDLEGLANMLKDASKFRFVITMPEKIIKTSEHCILSDDEKTATFTVDSGDFSEIIEIMVSTKKETKSPTIRGVKDGETYSKQNRDVIDVTAFDKSGIKEAKYKIDNGEYKDFNYLQGERFFKIGSYTLYAKDYYGNKTVVKFKIK